MLSVWKVIPAFANLSLQVSSKNLGSADTGALRSNTPSKPSSSALKIENAKVNAPLFSSDLAIPIASPLVSPCGISSYKL